MVSFENVLVKQFLNLEHFNGLIQINDTIFEQIDGTVNIIICNRANDNVIVKICTDPFTIGYDILQPITIGRIKYQ